MPELPEVEIARRALHRWGTGRRVEAVVVEDPGCVRGRLTTRPSEALAQGGAVLTELLTGGVLQEPRRLGKRMGWPVGGGAGVLVHLGMTGRWVCAAEAPRFARVGLVLDDGQRLWFADSRRFGCLVPTDDLEELLGSGLGPDALEAPPDGPALAARCRTRRAVKVALLDQAVLAGLGNIHAAEVLWLAGVSPTARCLDLSEGDWERLAGLIPEYLAGVLDLEGDEVIYLSEGGDGSAFAVYGKEGQACRRCGEAIARFSQAGRGTWWCPGCQVDPVRDTGPPSR